MLIGREDGLQSEKMKERCSRRAEFPVAARPFCTVRLQLPQEQLTALRPSAGER